MNLEDTILSDKPDPKRQVHDITSMSHLEESNSWKAQSRTVVAKGCKGGEMEDVSQTQSFSYTR